LHAKRPRRRLSVRSAAEQSLKRFAAAHPAVAPRLLDEQQAFNEMTAAVERNDGQAALARAATMPNLQYPPLLFIKGRAHLLVNDYSSADSEFHRTLLFGRNQANFGTLVRRFPAVEILSHYYLGQLYERSGKRDQAINEYQEFLSHFGRSYLRLPQVSEARTAVKRLMQ
jgi:tetratricopeptide (TPR) repeat protein